jgi:hypothetical protein
MRGLLLARNATDGDGVRAVGGGLGRWHFAGGEQACNGTKKGEVTPSHARRFLDQTSDFARGPDHGAIAETAAGPIGLRKRGGAPSSVRHCLVCHPRLLAQPNAWEALNPNTPGGTGR